MKARSILTLIAIACIALLTIMCGSLTPGSSSPPPTAPPAASCTCPLTSGSLDNTAADGSYVEVHPNSCIQPPPCAQSVQVESRQPGDWGLTDDQLRALEQKGEIYSVLDITPNDRTWDPTISVRFTLKQPSPRDNFALTIYQWHAADGDWFPAGTATAEKKDDRQAHGEIAHTSLFALVDQQTPVAPTVAPTLAPQPVADFDIEKLGGDAFLLPNNPRGTRVGGGCSFTVMFANLSRDADTFFWDFGDGSTSSESNPTHAYNLKDGVALYSVRLAVAGPGGNAEQVKADYIEAKCVPTPPPAPPIADFFAKPGDRATYLNPNDRLDTRVAGGCSFSVMFVNLSKNADTFLWDFGDGTTSIESNPLHTYSRSNEGTVRYTVLLVASGPGGKTEEAKTGYVQSQCIG